ncbi:MAG: hypothetical protein N2486_09215 [Caloramator sp.]|nr:hypothetical protein [Caloramator sp.]
MDYGSLLSTLNFDGRSDNLLTTLIILGIIFFFGKDQCGFGCGHDDCCCKHKHKHHKHCCRCCCGKQDDSFFIILLIALVLLLSQNPKDDKC